MRWLPHATRGRWRTGLTMLLIAAACGIGPALADDGPTSAELRNAASSTEWLLPNHDYSTQRHVPLTQIRRDNAADLRPVCSYDIGDTSRFGSGPLVYRGVMYVTSGDTTVALDAATCALRWRHVWRGKNVPDDGGPPRTVANAFKSRGAAIKDGKLVRATSDSHLIVLDLTNGKVLWARQVAASGQYEFVLMAPLIVDDLAIAGVGISEYAVKGWLGAFRLSDGEPVWRFNTVPASAGADLVQVLVVEQHGLHISAPATLGKAPHSSCSPHPGRWSARWRRRPPKGAARRPSPQGRRECLQSMVNTAHLQRPACRTGDIRPPQA